jgi:cell fate (sporulation/competence/biofilm development) regulator YlbF (YheA/YmcA/DUF963 family)
MPLRAAHPAVGKPMSKNTNFPPELLQATESLTQNLLASKPFSAYHASQERMKSDQTAQALLERLSAVQSELRRKQSSGGVTQIDVDKLRAVQAQVQTNETIIAYAQCQQEAIAYLREINQEISQLLGVDFAVLAKQNSC